MNPGQAEELRRRQARSQRGFYRALGGGSDGSQVVDLAGGVQATVVPVRPAFSIFNAVVYNDVSALREAIPRLATTYEDAGVEGWSVWARPEDEEAARLLATEGHREEGSPLVMGAFIGELDLASRRKLELDPEITWADVARCNDRAHGVLAEWSMVAAFESMDDPTTGLYGSRVDGEFAAALLARRLQGDCYFWFVATVPEAQQQGLGAELMRVALRDAKEAGCETATLESTPAGERLYTGLGFHPLGRTVRWGRHAAWGGPDPSA